MDDKHLLENIYVAQVLVLAKQIKAEKAAKNMSSSGDYTDDAVRLISEKRAGILRTLRP